MNTIIKKQFEYKTFNYITFEELNLLGSQGWQVVKIEDTYGLDKILDKYQGIVMREINQPNYPPDSI